MGLIDDAPTIETCEDAVSIEVAIQTTWMILNGMGYPKDQNEELDQTIKAVFDTAPRVAPSRPSGEWTAWKDGLPGCDEEVLVTDGTFIWIDELQSDGDMYWWDVQNVDPDTTAWMPLPEPYKESE